MQILFANTLPYSSIILNNGMKWHVAWAGIQADRAYAGAPVPAQVQDAFVPDTVTAVNARLVGEASAQAYGI